MNYELIQAVTVPFFYWFPARLRVGGRRRFVGIQGVFPDNAERRDCRCLKDFRGYLVQRHLCEVIIESSSLWFPAGIAAEADIGSADSQGSIERGRLREEKSPAEDCRVYMSLPSRS